MHSPKIFFFLFRIILFHRLENKKKKIQFEKILKFYENQAIFTYLYSILLIPSPHPLPTV